MENENPNFLSQLSILWGRMNSSERLIVVASVLILIIAIVIWISFARVTNMATLYGGLEPRDAGDVIAQLQSRNIEYKVADGGKTIMVPADQVDELRISLAADGFMPTGTTGYELFDKNTLGMSDFLQRKQSNRAIEGEIARTLMSLEEVSAARVHLTIPESSPFISEQEEPMASVVLNVVPAGRKLADAKVAAIRTFVAGAIGSIKPDNVTIIDQNMNLLTGPQDTSPSGLLPNQEELRRKYESEMTNKIRSQLEKAYGMGKVAVSYTCVMNFDQVSTESVKVDPLPGTDHGVLVSEESTETSAKGEGYNSAAGIPGTESNIPSYPGVSNQPFETESATETKNYEVSQTHETRIQAPGTVTKQSVSVLIDNTDPKDPEQERTVGPNEQKEVQNLVASAAMLDVSGGDSITVAFRKFDTRHLTDIQAEQKKISTDKMVDTIVRVVIALLIIGLVWIAFKSLLKPIGGVIPVGAGAAGFDEREIGVELPTADPEELEKLRIREEIEKLIKDDPGAAAKVIKTWLQE